MEYFKIKHLAAAIAVLSMIGCSTISAPKNSDGTWQRTSFTDNRPEQSKANPTKINPNSTLIKGLITFVALFVHNTSETAMNTAYFPNAANNDYNVVHTANELNGNNAEYRDNIVKMWETK